MIIRSKSRLLVQQEVSAVPRTAGMEEKQEIFELWLLSFFLIVHIKLDLRCQVMKTLELPTSHLQTNCSHCFPVFSARMINNWSICGSADGGWKLPLMVLPMFCDMDADFLKCLPEEKCLCAEFILDINFLEIMTCLSSKTNSTSLRDLSPLIWGQDQESSIYFDLKHPPGSRNLNLSAFSSRYDGRCTAEADLGIGPIFLISSWKLYSSGNMSNRSLPSQIIFWILELSKKLDRRTRSAWLYAIILNTNSSIVLKQKLQCQPASASIRSVCLECRYRVPGWNMCAVARQLL